MSLTDADGCVVIGASNDERHRSCLWRSGGIDLPARNGSGGHHMHHAGGGRGGDRSGGQSHCRCLNAFTRDMISGRGFIGIAAQSLGMGRPVLHPHLGADLQRSQCGGLRCRASEGPRSWLPCCPALSPNRGADAGRYAEKTSQIHTSPIPRMRPSLLKPKGPRRQCLRGFVLL